MNQDFDAIVNTWNRNIVPWRLLTPQGVSRAIRKRAAAGPFRELDGLGPIRLGGAVLTSAGRLPSRGIIHVAGIDLPWRASERSVRLSIRKEIGVVSRAGFASIAFPLTGAGCGGGSADEIERLMLDKLDSIGSSGRAVVVRNRASR